MDTREQQRWRALTRRMQTIVDTTDERRSAA